MSEPACPVNGCDRLHDLETRVKSLEDDSAGHDIQFAKINTKLNGILWGVGVIGTAVVGVLVKMLFAV